MRREITIRLAFMAVVLLAATASTSQKKTVKQGDSVSETATIVAIDHTNRIVTLRQSDGQLEDMYAGPEVKRFDELHVGDKVTFTYSESVVYQVRRPGEASNKSPDNAAIVRSTGPKPGATISEQRTATVTVEALDPAVPSITVRTQNGHKLSAKVEDKNNLAGVKVGDKVDITYTEALMITVEGAKK